MELRLVRFSFWQSTTTNYCQGKNTKPVFCTDFHQDNTAMAYF